MGFWKKLFGIGAAAGATVAAVKVADKVKKNNPDGIGDVNGDGKVNAADYAQEIKKAAGEVYRDAADAVKEAAPKVAGKAQSASERAVTTVEDALNGVKPGREPKE